MKSFQTLIKNPNVKNILVLTGAGISAESGVPTFRGVGGYWGKYNAKFLATPEAFHSKPGLLFKISSN